MKKLITIPLLLAILLGGALQTIAAHGGTPPDEPAHNIAVSHDTDRAESRAIQLPAKGDHDRCHRRACRCTVRFRPVPVTGTLLPESGVLDKFSSQSIQIWNAACLRQSQQFFGTDISAASVKWSGTISDVLPYAVQTLQLRHGLMDVMVRILRNPADLTSSKLGGVLYCISERRWLPDERDDNAERCLDPGDPEIRFDGQSAEGNLDRYYGHKRRIRKHRQLRDYWHLGRRGTNEFRDLSDISNGMEIRYPGSPQGSWWPCNTAFDFRTGRLCSTSPRVGNVYGVVPLENNDILARKEVPHV